MTKRSTALRSRSRRRLGMWVVAPTLAMALLVASCGSSSDSAETIPSAPAGSNEASELGTQEPTNDGMSGETSESADAHEPSGELTKVKAAFSFPYAASPWYCVYDYGKDKGFYQKYGIDPTFGGLSGSSTIVNEVAAGHVDIGLSVGVTSIIPAVQKGAKIKLVATQERDSENAIISLKDNPIEKPEDLKGKSIGYGASTVFNIAFPLLLDANSIDESDVTIHNVQPTSYAATLQSGSIDGYASFPSSSVPNQKKAGGDPVVMLFKDYGLNLTPSNGYIAGDELIKNDPDEITNFLKGARDSWTYLYNHPEELPDAGKFCEGEHQGVKADAVEDQLKVVFDLNKDQLSGNNIMSIDPDGVSDQADLLVKAGVMSDAGDVDDYYTDALIPSDD